MRLSLIIADDNKDFTEIMSDFLDSYKDLEISILGLAYNGLEAIDLITKYEPDIMILDMLMPKLDGIGVLRKLKTLNLKKMPRIIFLTALENQEVINEALTYNVEYYIEKPFDMDILVSKIKKIGATMLESAGTAP